MEMERGECRERRRERRGCSLCGRSLARREREKSSLSPVLSPDGREQRVENEQEQVRRPRVAPRCFRLSLSLSLSLSVSHRFAVSPAPLVSGASVIAVGAGAAARRIGPDAAWRRRGRRDAAPAADGLARWCCARAAGPPVPTPTPLPARRAATMSRRAVSRGEGGVVVRRGGEKLSPIRAFGQRREREQKKRSPVLSLSPTPPHERGTPTGSLSFVV